MIEVHQPIPDEGWTSDNNPKVIVAPTRIIVRIDWHFVASIRALNPGKTNLGIAWSTCRAAKRSLPVATGGHLESGSVSLETMLSLKMNHQRLSMHRLELSLHWLAPPRPAKYAPTLTVAKSDPEWSSV
jgi:hypothetical protein